MNQPVEGPLILRRTAEQPNPVPPEAEHGRLLVVLNLLEDDFTFGDDIVGGYRCLEYARIDRQWRSTRKWHSCLGLGKEDLLQAYQREVALAARGKKGLTHV
jgi:hypothetical protein